MRISATTPEAKRALQDFTGKLAAFLNEQLPQVAGKVDYGMLAVPLVGCAVQVLQKRGFDKGDIEQAILQSMDAQFKETKPNLILLPGGR